MMISLPMALFMWPVELGGDTDFISVSGESMLPTIPDGSFAIVKRDLSYDVGDIIAYNYSEGSLSKVVVHRIIDKSGSLFVLKGDNNRSVDPVNVHPDMIIGKVMLYLPYLGYLPILVKNPVVLLLTFAITAASLLPSEKASKKTTIQRKSSLFVATMIINAALYVLTQVAISQGVAPKDPYTSFLSRLFVPYLASTMSFVTVHIAIVGSYIISKRSYRVRETQSGSLCNVRILVERGAGIHSLTELFWISLSAIAGIYAINTIVFLLTRN
jgi:signal peptidase I